MTDVPSCAAGVPFLRALPHAALVELGQAMRHRHIERGQVLALAGDPVEHLIVVAQGRLKLAQTTISGREQLLRTVDPGEFHGELALFAPARYDGDLIALDPSEVCLLGREAVQGLLTRHPDAAITLVETLARRLTQAERMIADLGLHDVGQRLAGELLRASGDATVANDTRVRLPVPWREVAARIGTTPESLSRRLRVLADAGIVRQERARTVVILDAERLRLLADS